MIAPNNNTPKKVKHNNNFKFTRLVVWAIVGISALVLVFVLRHQYKVDAEPIETRVGAGKIKEATPSIASKPAPKPKPKAETYKERRMREINAGIYTDDRGVKRYANGARVPVEPDVVVDLRNLKNRKFTFSSERQIAEVLMAIPGERLIGEIRYGEAFEEDFRNSLTNKIEIYEEDSEETVELKQAVIDTKADLAERMRNGESVAEIMAAARKEAQDIALYRDDLKQQVDRIIEEGVLTEEDEKDLYDAANTMLEQRGAKPLRMPSTIIRQLRQYMKEKKGIVQ